MKHTLRYLRDCGFISQDSYVNLTGQEDSLPLSLFWHIRTLLYLGVTLLATSIGIIIYNNIDTIGHLTLILIIAVACLGCFYYSFKNSPAFTNEKSDSTNTWNDYIILLGTLLFLSLEGYLQFQYNIFGMRYGLATIIPAIILFAVAYRFDHLGILSMGITLFASWLGLTLTPLELLIANDFTSVTVVKSGIILCILLVSAGYVSRVKNLKEHFDFTYYNFGIHLGAVAILTAAFTFDFGMLWLLLIIPLLLFTYSLAVKTNSFYFLLCAFVYAYIAVSYVLIKAIFKMDSDFILGSYILMFYFIGTGIFAIRFLKQSHKKMSAHGGV